MPLAPGEEMIAAVRAELPELPAERAERFRDELGLKGDRAHELAFATEQADFFEASLAAGGAAASATDLANWMPQLVERIGSDADPAGSRVTPGALAELARLVAERTISRDAGRAVLTALVEQGGEPGTIVEREGLQAMTDGLADIVRRAIESDPEAAAKVRDGNMKAVGPLVGFVMRETRGRADGGEVTRLIREQVSSGA